MKRLISGLFFIVCLISLSCNKDAKKEQVVMTEAPQVMEDSEVVPAEIPVEELSMDGLVGKWLLLDSEGEVDPSGDFLLIAKEGDEYKGVFVYQGFTRNCTLITESGDYFAVSEQGERYKINRIRSSYEKEHNGIGLDLIVGSGFDDIGVGYFQREDVLKRLEE